MNKEQKKVFDSGDYQHNGGMGIDTLTIKVKCIPNDTSIEPFTVEYTGTEISDMGMDYVFDFMDEEDIEEFDRELERKENEV